MSVRCLEKGTRDETDNWPEGRAHRLDSVPHNWRIRFWKSHPEIRANKSAGFTQVNARTRSFLLKKEYDTPRKRALAATRV